MSSPTINDHRPAGAARALALFVPVVLLAISGWQLACYRAQAKIWDAFSSASAAAFELPRAPVPPPRYSHVHLVGRYLTERQFLLGGASQDGESGYRVLTPLEREHGETVLIDRGWLPRHASGAIPDLSATTDVVEITGHTDLLQSIAQDGAHEPNKDWPKLFSNPSLDALERALGRPLYPQIVLLDASLPGGYLRDWQPPGLRPAWHLSFALLALGAALLCLWLMRRSSALDPA